MTKLFKYRPFGINSLSELCESEIYFSDPKKFNDPLDCSPTILNDVDFNNIERLCFEIIVKASNRDEAAKKIQNYQYLSTEYGDYKSDPEVQKYYIGMLLDEIKLQLDNTMKNNGVLSLASEWNSPLMWSHYADDHKGICIEYDISQSVCDKPIQVDYKGNRGIKASTIIDWVLNNNENCKAEIEKKYFYTKANQWEYEKEWRFISDTQGVKPIPFPLCGIYFGMRCPLPVISSVVKLMNGSRYEIAFYHTYASHDSFEVLRREVEVDELVSLIPRPSAALVFGNIQDK